MLLLPIEIWHREGPSSIFLALEMVSRGHSVCVGAQPSVQSLAARFPYASVYLDKSLSKAKESWYKGLPKRLKIVSHDIEFTGFINPDLYASARFSQKNINRSSAVIFHNKDEKALIEGSFDHVKSPNFVGSYKFEFIAKFSNLLYREKSQQLKEKYGEFTFIPSNFGGGFRDGGLPALFKWADGHFESELCEKFKSKALAREEVRRDFIVAIKKVSESNPHRNYILRPHPTESINSWKQVEFPRNVFVIFEGPLLPYLLACKQLMHAGCSSVIDAALLGKQQNVFLPDYKDVKSWPFYSIAGECENTVEEYVKASIKGADITSPDFKSDETLAPISDSYFLKFSEFLDDFIVKSSNVFVAKSLIKIITLFTSNKFNERKYSEKDHLEMLKILDLSISLKGLESNIQVENVHKSRCIFLTQRV
jgi:surface carbohydrate biosynthesis protein